MQLSAELQTRCLTLIKPDGLWYRLPVSERQTASSKGLLKVREPGF